MRVEWDRVAYPFQKQPAMKENRPQIKQRNEKTLLSKKTKDAIERRKSLHREESHPDRVQSNFIFMQVNTKKYLSSFSSNTLGLDLLVWTNVEQAFSVF